MTYLLPPEWTNTMIPLQQECTQSSLEEIDSMFKKDIGKGINDVFVEFEQEPIGVASLAQVHKAKIFNPETGNVQEVAVKCQHPTLSTLVPLDVMLTSYIFQVLDWWFPEYSLVWLSEELRESIFVELDFNNERKNAEKTALHFNQRQFDFLTIPRVFDAHKRFIIMEFLTGSRLDAFDYEQHDISRSKVSNELGKMVNEMIFNDSVGVHTDIHGGNIAIKYNPKKADNFEVILYDHGLYRYPTVETRLLYSKFWLSLLNRDVEGMKKYLVLLGRINDDEFPLLAACLTGRSINTIVNEDLLNDTNDLALRENERNEMRERFLSSNSQGGDIFLQLMSILSKIPSVVLLLLKANDLNRHLQESVLSHDMSSQREYVLDTLRTYLMVGLYASRNVLKNDTQQSFVKRWLINFKWSFRVFAFDWYIKFDNLKIWIFSKIGFI